MGDESNRQIVERYVGALPEDFETLGDLRHSSYIEEWPQSGERIVGHEAYRKIHEKYPGGLPTAATRKIVGSEDRWVATPFSLVRISGTGEVYTVEGRLTYPSGEHTHLVAILELRDGKVLRATHYFADPFEAPEWRAEFVEKMWRGFESLTPHFVMSRDIVHRCLGTSFHLTRGAGSPGSGPASGSEGVPRLL